MIRGRKGFTFIELLIVCAVIGILAGLAVLKYMDLRYRALSAQVVGDLEAIRLAAYTGYYETGSWAAETGPGLMPAQLVPWLPASRAFQVPVQKKAAEMIVRCRPPSRLNGNPAR